MPGLARPGDDGPLVPGGDTTGPDYFADFAVDAKRGGHGPCRAQRQRFQAVLRRQVVTVGFGQQPLNDANYRGPARRLRKATLRDARLAGR